MSNLQGRMKWTFIHRTFLIRIAPPNIALTIAPKKMSPLLPWAFSKAPHKPMTMRLPQRQIQIPPDEHYAHKHRIR